jgi:hypothetical protein
MLVAQCVGAWPISLGRLDGFYNDFGTPSRHDNSVTRIGVTSAELKAGAIVSFGQASDQPSAWIFY